MASELSAQNLQEASKRLQLKMHPASGETEITVISRKKKLKVEEIQ